MLGRRRRTKEQEEYADRYSRQVGDRVEVILQVGDCVYVADGRLINVTPFNLSLEGASMRVYDLATEKIGGEGLIGEDDSRKISLIENAPLLDIAREKLVALASYTPEKYSQ
jgi:hypothetical protein